MAEQQYVGMTPTVVIGLGGTGKEVLMKIRRRIVETYGSLEALPIVSFLHIDTEGNAKVSEPQVVLKQNIELAPAEQVWAKVENAKPILQDLSSYSYLESWFPPQLKGTASILAGAGQIRALGKFAFCLNHSAIKKSFSNAKDKIIGHEKVLLEQGIEIDKGLNIFVVCSLSGGTGSGMVLDLAYNLRDWVPRSELPQISAFLVLPGAFTGLGDKVVANAYAALMELNHYSRSDTRFECQYSSSPSDRISSTSGQDVPFDFCYLVGNSNDKTTLPSLNLVLEMVAQNVFLDFSSGFSQYKKLVRDNIKSHWSSPDVFGYPQNFIAFGLSSIQFPIQRVLQACTSRLAHRVVSWWTNPNAPSTVTRDLIQTEILPKLQLAESYDRHQILDSISLGDGGKTYSREVAEWVIGLRRRRDDLPVPNENLKRYVEVEQEKFGRNFSDRSEYFRKMSENLDRLKVAKRQELRNTVYEAIEDRFRGPKFVRQFLNELLRIFDDYGSQFNQDREKTWIPREQSATRDIQTFLNLVEEHAKQVSFFNNQKAAIDKDFNNILTTLESLYTAKIEVKSRTFGVILLDALKEEVNALVENLNNFERKLETIQNQLLERENTYIKETGAANVNGISLFDSTAIEQTFNYVYAENADPVCQSISQDVLNELRIRLFDLAAFDVLRLKDISDRLLRRAVDGFEVKSQLQISTARKFLEQYPTLEQQRAQIKTTFEKSEPFLRFSAEQVAMGWDNKQEVRQTLIGIQGGEQPADEAAKAILPMIKSAGIVTDKDIRPLNDPNHIYFVHEVGAFPLRLIEGAGRMRTVYHAVSQSDRNPLHTHKDPRQFEDIMPLSLQEKADRRSLVLAKVFGLIAKEENRASGFDTIRIHYQDKETGIDRFIDLGNTWEEAEEKFLSDRGSKLREIVAASLKEKGDRAVTKPQKLELYQALIAYLNERESNLRGGRDNPEYQVIEEVIAFYIKEYNLKVDSLQVPAPSAGTNVPVVQVNENLEKFRKLAETCYKKGNPTPTELQLLERFRLKYEISQEAAAQIVASLTSVGEQQNAAEEYSLMFRAFLENDGDIDMDEQAQLLELQEELGLTNDRISEIESSVRQQLRSRG